MRSQSSPVNLRHLSRLRTFQPPQRFSVLPISTARFDSLSRRHRSSSSYLSVKLYGSNVGKGHRRRSRYHTVLQIQAIDEDSVGFSGLDDWHDNEGAVLSSSDGEYSDTDIVINPVNDIDLPSVTVSNDGALTVSAHRLAMLGRGRKTHKIRYGMLINLGLLTFLTVLLLFVDWCAWKIVRLPLAPFYLTRPFFVSAVIVSCVGYLCVPLLRTLKFLQIIRKEGPLKHIKKNRTPTMGGLFFIPVGVAVAEVVTNFSSAEVSGAAIATVAFAVIGFFDDLLSLIKNKNSGLSAWSRIFLEVAVGTWFSFWLDSTGLTSPYGMKMLVPLPAPLGLVYFGKFYLLLTSFCFVSMGNGMNLTDGLDGLAGGTAALAFVGMSIAVLPICSDLAIFGASMAGACVGFLLYNRYKASVFMGDTGSLALGGALAAMAACTGMFFPLLISSGIFVVEASSVIMQVMYFKTTKRLHGKGRRLFRMAPFHHHLELCGLKEPIIVAGAYIISCIMALFAGYVGLTSA